MYGKFAHMKGVIWNIHLRDMFCLNKFLLTAFIMSELGRSLQAPMPWCHATKRLHTAVRKCSNNGGGSWDCSSHNHSNMGKNHFCRNHNFISPDDWNFTYIEMVNWPCKSFTLVSEGLFTSPKNLTQYDSAGEAISKPAGYTREAIKI